MLQQLRIENFALIDKLDISFESGLCTITGETGAGKSILLGGLSLLLGNRADSTIIKSGENNCIVEGHFNIKAYKLPPFFEENDLDYDDITIVRRLVSSSGKSRAFINEIPVTLQTLRDFSLQLIDIHSQHENLSLANSIFQQKVVDAIAGNALLLDTAAAAYRSMLDAEKAYQRLKSESERAKEEEEYIRFQVEQLAAASLKLGELTELEAEIKQLTHAEEIKAALTSAENALDSESGEISGIPALTEADAYLKRVVEYLPALPELSERLYSCLIEVKDIAREITLLNDHQDINPERLITVQQRMDLLYTLMQKHKCKSEDQLIAIQSDLEQELLLILNSDEELKKSEDNLTEQELKFRAIALQLNKARNGIKEQIISKTEDMLKKLGIPNARLAIEIEANSAPTVTGSDKVTFLFSANMASPLLDMGRVASGGEMSRLMLALKAQMAKAIDLPTIVFDEIDAGISGEIAHKMGEIIAQMAQAMQVVNITHLPQIAAKGSQHLMVYKETLNGNTTTKIKRLDSEERVVEIAKMLSGQKLSEAAMQNARELLAQ
ncbi:DNA repair protein RecN [Williamwhitmania taraxaci]|uniref:DNA repair protein RecN n=1 Tax=Williamwhitmania taraxaci TaxID=1640674 RepID=A0A1G6K6K2_9BACT|nr:DNA repair protein RecN [Williamwhitmania taraxaci]SDC26630.1 DNA replication and repair protein RecN [Williamwhitmania taraxaci]